MTDQTRIVSPGPTDRAVRSAAGQILHAPDDWELLPPGDAALTRRVKAAGPTWTVQEKQGRKTFSRGVWAPADRIAAVRRRGYAVGNEDALDYLVAIGAPIFDHTGRITAALSVGGLAQRYPNERVDEVAELARAAALDISLRLGFQPNTDAITGNEHASTSTIAPAIQ